MNQLYRRVGKFYTVVLLTHWALCFSPGYRQYMKARSFVTVVYWQQVKDGARKTDVVGMLTQARILATSEAAKARGDMGSATETLNSLKSASDMIREHLAKTEGASR